MARATTMKRGGVCLAYTLLTLWLGAIPAMAALTMILNALAVLAPASSPLPEKPFAALGLS